MSMCMPTSRPVTSSSLGACIRSASEHRTGRTAETSSSRRFESVASTYLNTEECRNHVAGWTPVGGAGSLPSGNPFYLVVDLWDIQDGVSGEWYATFVHLADNNNQLHGRANYLHVKANVGVLSGPLTVGGGSHLALTDMSA